VLLRTQRMGPHWTHRSRPGIPIAQTPVGFPALQRACINTADSTGRFQPIRIHKIRKLIQDDRQTRLLLP